MCQFCQCHFDAKTKLLWAIGSAPRLCTIVSVTKYTESQVSTLPQLPREHDFSPWTKRIMASTFKGSTGPDDSAVTEAEVSAASTVRRRLNYSLTRQIVLRLGQEGTDKTDKSIFLSVLSVRCFGDRRVLWPAFRKSVERIGWTGPVHKESVLFLGGARCG